MEKALFQISVTCAEVPKSKYTESCQQNVSPVPFFTLTSLLLYRCQYMALLYTVLCRLRVGTTMTLPFRSTYVTCTQTKEVQQWHNSPALNSLCKRGKEPSKGSSIVIWRL